jgi:hypothetical protein
MRAPGRLGEPQGASGGQRRKRQGQMLSFHCSFPSCFIRQALCLDFWALASDLERRPGILVRSASEQE